VRPARGLATAGRALEMSLEAAGFHAAECRERDLAQCAPVSELMVQLERQSWAPGESVRGWARVLAPFDCRKLEAALEFREWSEDYNEVSTRLAVPLHSGPAQPGQWWYFELPVPPDAPAGFRSPHGGVYWQVDLKADQPGFDIHASQAIDVAGERSYPPESLSAPVPAAPERNTLARVLSILIPLVATAIFFAILGPPGLLVAVPLVGAVLWRWLRTARHFTVDVEPLRARRGERVAVKVSIPDTSKIRGELEVGLVCTERYAYRTSSSTSSSSVGGRSRTTRRQTREEQIYDQRQPVDPALQAAASFVLPPDGPFSHEGDPMGYRWTATARERRPRGTDRVAERRFRVVP
jgi:hypothetical protein